MDDTPKAPRKGRKRTEANGDAKPAFDKSKGLWVVWVWINGKRVKRSAKTLEGAKTLLKELNRLKDQGVQVPPERLTVAEWVHQWIQTKKAIGIDAGTIRNYEYHWKRIVQYVGSYSLLKLTTLHIQGSITRIVNEGKTAPSTIATYHAVLSSALENAVRVGMLPRNPAKGVQLPRKPVEKKAIALTPAQVRAFFNAARGDRYELAFWLAIATGGRRGEVLGMKWASISWDMKTVAITGQVKDMGGGKYGYAPYTKGRRPRVVRLPSVVMTILRRHREAQHWKRVAAGDTWADEDFVFPSRTGGPVNPDLLNAAIVRVIKKANGMVADGQPGEAIPLTVRSHSFRNSAGTLYMLLGASSREVQDILGHQSITTTEGYLSVLPVMSEQNAERMDGFLRELGG